MWGLQPTVKLVRLTAESHCELRIDEPHRRKQAVLGWGSSLAPALQAGAVQTAHRGDGSSLFRAVSAGNPLLIGASTATTDGPGRDHRDANIAIPY